MKLCTCGSKVDFAQCCGPYLDNAQSPTTPEALMRSRYSAYSIANIPYIKHSMRKGAALNFNEKEAYLWAKRVKWQGLEVVKSYIDEQNSDLGFVEFKAVFIDEGKKQVLHELSQFERMDNQWFYVAGIKPLKTVKLKTARNAPCPCGSEKKFKNCHGKV